MDKPKTQPGRAPPKSKTSGNSDKSAQMGEYIGRELRSMFNDVVEEPVPERFRQLLEKLEKKPTED